MTDPKAIDISPEAERERGEANTAYLEKTKLNFVEALEACMRGFEIWCSKPHSAKWWQRIDGTPIPNDLLVNIAEIVAQRANADRAERDAALSELAEHCDERIAASAATIATLRAALATAREALEFVRPCVEYDDPQDDTHAKDRLDKLDAALAVLDAVTPSKGE